MEPYGNAFAVAKWLLLAALLAALGLGFVVGRWARG